MNAYSELVSFLKEAGIGVHMYDSFQVSSQRVTSIANPSTFAIMDKVLAQVIELDAHLKVAQKQLGAIEKEMWALLEKGPISAQSAAQSARPKRSLSGERDMQQYHSRRRIKKESEETLALEEAKDGVEPHEDVTQTLQNNQDNQA